MRAEMLTIVLLCALAFWKMCISEFTIPFGLGKIFQIWKAATEMEELSL
jgi:hypothetical protein